MYHILSYADRWYAFVSNAVGVRDVKMMTSKKILINHMMLFLVVVSSWETEGDLMKVFTAFHSVREKKEKWKGKDLKTCDSVVATSFLMHLIHLVKYLTDAACCKRLTPSAEPSEVWGWFNWFQHVWQVSSSISEFKYHLHWVPVGTQILICHVIRLHTYQEYWYSPFSFHNTL